LNRTDLTNKDLIGDLEERKRLYEIGEKSLNDLVEELHKSKFSSLKIYGHTDENGSFDYNIGLSNARAQTVMNEIAKRWEAKYKEPFDKTKVDTIGRGESEPIKTNKGLNGVELQEVDALNRRIEYEIKYIKDLNNTESDKAKPKKENDFSKIRVNQSVFNFFKTRRQKCFEIPFTYQEIIDDKRTNQPEPIEIIEETRPVNQEVPISLKSNEDYQKDLDASKPFYQRKDFIEYKKPFTKGSGWSFTK
jgi:hypothetical protein